LLLAEPKTPPKTPSITAVLAARDTNVITVTFESPVDSIPTIYKTTEWSIIVGYDNKDPTTLKPDLAKASELSTSVDLTVTALSWDHVTSIAVYFGGVQKSTQLAPPGKHSQAKSYFTAAAQQSVADNYLTGSYSPAIHSAAQYTISGLGTLTPQLHARWCQTSQALRDSHTCNVYFGGTASVETDNRPSADPDSFFVSPLWQWVPISTRFWNCRAQGVLINWDMAGLQFDRSTTTKTLVSSVVMEVPLRVFPPPFKSEKPEPGKSEKGGHCNVAPKMVSSSFNAGVFPYVGISTGGNLSNALQPGGSGFVFDGIVGGLIDLTFKVPKATWLQKVELTGTDTLRLPSTDEIFTYVHYISQTGKTVSLPTLLSKPRNHVKGELDLTVAKPFSISIQYEDGELPPAYKTINNKVTVGIKILLQQSNNAAAKISTNTESQ
jgi:hypothetical protein